MAQQPIIFFKMFDTYQQCLLLLGPGDYDFFCHSDLSQNHREIYIAEPILAGLKVIIEGDFAHFQVIIVCTQRFS